MQNFEFSVRLADSGRAAPPLITVARGVSVGTSPDGSATVTIVGSMKATDEAERLAATYTLGPRDPLHCRVNDVAAVVVDHRTATIAVLSSPIGLRQVFWAIRGDELSIASDPRRLACLNGRAPPLRHEALFQYIYFHMVPSPGSIYEGVSKLDGGRLLRWDGREARLTRYWTPQFHDAAVLTEAEAAEQLRSRLQAAVERSLDSVEHAGAFLSGGLDSSTVAGLAAKQRPGISTVTMGFDAQGYDEMEYARIASRHFGTQPLEYYVTPEDVLATLPQIAAAFPEPFGNSSAAAVYHCARIAGDQGLELLLAGDGGDELFGGNERYAKQLVFERYQGVPRAVRKTLLEPVVGAAGHITRAFPIGKALSYIQQANVPLPDRLQSYNFLHRHDPQEVFTRELLERVDTSSPLRMLREEYGTPDTSDAVNRMLFLDWKFTLHDNDLVKVNTMCQMAGVDVAYPMLDQDVVDFSLCIPGDWKLRKGNLRWFYKRAYTGFLPDAIIRKTKHGFGLPFGVWTRTHPGLRETSEEALSSLAERGFLRREFILEALRLHREGHASYYGELVWIMTVLELWLQAHAPGPVGE
jgi:asparagine synthase (glutamine-hydrolysing)